METIEKFVARLPKTLVLLIVLCLLGNRAHAESFSVTDLKGKTHSLAHYKGKWVIVNFWATWCPPCLEEIPDLIMLHDKRKDVTVLGIAVDYKSSKEIAAFADDNLMTYPVVLGDDATVQQFGSADVLPTTYLYNPQGKLVKKHRGLVTRKYLENLLDSGNRGK